MCAFSYNIVLDSIDIAMLVITVNPRELMLPSIRVADEERRIRGKRIALAWTG